MDFFGGPFPWKKQEEKIHPQNPQQNANQNLGVSRPKSTLQRSSLEILFFLFGGFLRAFFLGKKTHPKIHEKIQIRIWSFAAKIHTARVWTATFCFEIVCSEKKFEEGFSGGTCLVFPGTFLLAFEQKHQGTSTQNALSVTLLFRTL